MRNDYDSHAYYEDDEVENFVRNKQADMKRARFRRKIEHHKENQDLWKKIQDDYDYE